MNKIINPQNGLEYDLFSQEGLHILNMFIRTYKNGGAKSRKRTNREISGDNSSDGGQSKKIDNRGRGDVEFEDDGFGGGGGDDIEMEQVERTVPLTERVTETVNAVLETVADLEVRAEDIAEEFTPVVDESIFEFFKSEFIEIVQQNPGRYQNMYQITLFANLIIVTLFFCNLSATKFGLDQPILDKLIEIMFQYVESLFTGQAISIAVDRFFQIIKYLSIPTILGGSVKLFSDVVREGSLRLPVSNKARIFVGLILGGAKVVQGRIADIRDNFIKSLLKNLLNIAKEMTNKQYSIIDSGCDFLQNTTIRAVDYVKNKLSDSIYVARNNITNFISGKMTPDQKYITGLTSFEF